jgi:hypothetical protein
MTVVPEGVPGRVANMDPEMLQFVEYLRAATESVAAPRAAAPVVQVELTPADLARAHHQNDRVQSPVPVPQRAKSSNGLSHAVATPSNPLREQELVGSSWGMPTEFRGGLANQVPAEPAGLDEPQPVAQPKKESRSDKRARKVAEVDATWSRFTKKAKLCTAAAAAIIVGAGILTVAKSSDKHGDASASILKSRASATAAATPGTSTAAVAPSSQPAKPRWPTYVPKPVGYDAAHPAAVVAVHVETDLAWNVTVGKTTKLVDGIYPAITYGGVDAKGKLIPNGTAKVLSYLSSPEAVTADPKQDNPDSEILDINPADIVSLVDTKGALFGIVATDSAEVLQAVSAAIPAADTETAAELSASLLSKTGKVISQNSELTKYQINQVYELFDKSAAVQKAIRGFIEAKVRVLAKAQGIGSVVFKYIGNQYSIASSSLKLAPLPTNVDYIPHAEKRDPAQTVINVTPENQ